MSWRTLLNRLRDRTRRRQLDHELDMELRFHHEMLQRDFAMRGASTEDAERLALVQLGHQVNIKEEARTMWGLGIFDDLLQDLRYASRVLRHNKVFTVTVVLTLALGIGANAAIFSVVNAVLLRPLPYAAPDRLFSLWTAPVSAPDDRRPTSLPDLQDWREQNTSFAAIGAYAYNRFEIDGPQGVDLARGVMANGPLYDVLRAKSLLGRLPRADEEREAVVTISHRLWMRQFGGQENAIGQSITIDNRDYTIIGVMPPGFHFPTPEIELWTTMLSILSSGPEAQNPWLVNRSFRGYRTLGRLRDGVTPQAAEAEMNAIMDRIGTQFPNNSGSTDVRLRSVREDEGIRDLSRALWLVLGAAGLVLLLACANVAHLMLARVSTRTREMGIRRALGAHRTRIVRQLLTESLLLGIIGGIAGLAVAAAGIRLLVHLNPGDIPRIENVSIDATTLAFAALLSIVTGVLFGIAPTMMMWRGGVEGAMREQTRSVGTHGKGFRATLTAAEVAFALILLVGAGLMLRSFTGLLSRDPGFNTRNVAVFGVTFPSARYATPADRATGLQRVIDAVTALPGVVQVGGSTSLPPNRMQQGTGYRVEGEPEVPPGQSPTATFIPASPQFLSTIGVPLIAGRHFTDGDNTMDTASQPVVIVNEELARRHFSGRDPVGQRILLGDQPWTIAGVVGDVPYQGLATPPSPAIYMPWARNPSGGAYVVVKTSGDPRTLLPLLNSTVHRVDAQMNAREPQLLSEAVTDSVVRPRFQTWLLGMFGGLALALAAIGIYGVIAYGVAQRAAEIGLRIAVGASPRSVIQLLMTRAMMPVVAGIVAGLFGAFAIMRVMQSLLVEVSPSDLPTFAATTVVLFVVAFVAAFIPVSRATRSDPVAALRSD